MHQVYQKMYPELNDELIENSLIGTIEPLSSDTEFTLATSLNLNDNNNNDENLNNTSEISNEHSPISNEENTNAQEIQNN